ncbi:MAG TPA: transporter substrate-binding domain-containing protein [Thermoanaerobaculia bacterium]
MKRSLFVFAVLAIFACGERTVRKSPSPNADPQTSAAQSSTSASADPAIAELPDLRGRTIVVGTDPTTPPFESVDRRTNQIVGFDIDVMRAVADRINAVPEFRTADFKTIFAALSQGEFDAVISAATITEDRKKMVAFSDPYVQIGQLVAVRKGNSKIRGIGDLKAEGVLVGVQTGTTGEQVALRAQVKDKSLRRYDTLALALADLAKGSIDAIIDDQPILSNYLSQPEYRDHLVMVGQPEFTDSYGIAVKKTDAALLDAINRALTRLRAEGVLDKLAAQHRVR